jgi:hypothetical protein
MKPLPNRHNVREFVESLEVGSRVIWIANSARGTVQPDKTILWDDGTHMTHKQMNHSHALLIHSEAEWLGLRAALTSMTSCVQPSCTLQSWDDRKCKLNRPEKLCPLGVLPPPNTEPLPPVRRRAVRALRLGLRPQTAES